MPIITEKLLRTLADQLRRQLEQINIGGASNWDPIFSNAHGIGDGNTLVIIMRPIDSDKDLSLVAMESKELKDIIDEVAKQNKLAVSKLSFANKDKGFVVAVSLSYEA